MREGAGRGGRKPGALLHKEKDEVLKDIPPLQQKLGRTKKGKGKGERHSSNEKE